MKTSTMPENTHHGKAVKRIREILHIKQDVLAEALGISQQSISLLETKETIDPETLEHISKILKVPVEALKTFNEEAAYNIIGNTVTTVNDSATGQIFQFNPTINPIEKWIETLEENKKLYERLLKEKDEKINLLEKILDGKKK